jgi:hypothetical protein
MKIWINKKDFEGRAAYSIKLSQKDKESKQEICSMYLDIQFPRDKQPEAGQIEIKDGFFTCYQTKTGVKPKLVVMDYEYLQASKNDRLETKIEPVKKEKDPFADVFEEFGNTVVIEDDNDFLD